MARPRLAVTLAAALLATACSSEAPTAPPSAMPVPGGSINIGVWQRPNSFLDAGVIGSTAFAHAIAAPSQEGLLWYRSVPETSRAVSPADYWSPDLATEVPTTTNGDVRTSGCDKPEALMCVSWKLRKGVQWHDGHELSAHDVCATAQLYWLKYGATGRPNPTLVNTTGGWRQLIACNEADRYTAVFDFNSLYGPYLTLGSGVYGVLPATVVDAALSRDAALDSGSTAFDLRAGSGNPGAFHGTGTLATVLDGTGPFVFHGIDAAGDVVLVRNANYWRHSGLPHLDQIVFKIEPDLPTELKEALSGAIDVGLDLRLDSLQPLRSAAGGASPLLRVQTIPASGAEKIDLNLCGLAGDSCDNLMARKSEYTADPAIRKAMLAGIDRDAIVKAVAPGLTSVPKDSSMYLGAAYLIDSSLPQTAYDPRVANLLLDNAGYSRDPMCGAAPDGKPYRRFKDMSCVVINLGTASDSEVRLAVAALVRKDMQSLGINVPEHFTPDVPLGTLLDSFSGGGPLYTHAYDAVIYTLTLGVPGEPDSYYSTYHGDCGGTCPERNQVPSSGNRGQGTNITGVSDPRLDEALDKGRAVLDPVERKGLYVQAEQRLAAIVAEIPLYQQIVVNSLSVRLAGVQDNDIIWDFNTADWFCVPAANGRGMCQA